MLSKYRVLDLSDDKGILCGKILADLGAEVIKIEKPGGDDYRNIGPFYQNDPHSEKSLFCFAYNNNKKGITLNINSYTGQIIFKKLLLTSDILIESFQPGFLDSLNLDYQTLKKINEKIILVSITAFGQEGPYSRYRASDLSLMAMGGFVYLNGDADRPPVRVSYPQSYFLASAEASVGALMALYARDIYGSQHVDVSIQQVVALSLLSAPRWWDLCKIIPSRMGHNFYRTTNLGSSLYPYIFQCKNGYVSYVILTGAMLEPIARWMKDEGFECSLADTDWETWNPDLLGQGDYSQIAEDLANFFKRYTREELYEQAHERHILLMPLANMEDVYRNQQLKARRYWVELGHEDLNDKICYPGAFVKASETPLKISRRAPHIGEHNEDIYINELGYSKEQLVILKETGII